MLKDKTVILGVCGSIAAYKIANLTSMLKKTGVNVQVIMTKNAANFINPITFETLTGNRCLIDTFDRNFEYNVEHIELSKKADVVLVAPASANIIGKIANGIADDMLTTTIMACKCKKLISPAMNTNMYENPVVQDNIKKLENYGMEIIQPASGLLACGDVGSGKLPSEGLLMDAIMREIKFEKDMRGKRVLITAGATREAIDPVRFISNHSTGKMGYSIAETAMRRGAEVTLVTAHTDIPVPEYLSKVVPVVSSQDMFEAVKSLSDSQDVIIKAAAVSDYTPSQVFEHKVKKKDDDMSIPLKRTVDILKWLGENRKPGQFLCGFSMETENMLENSRAKLKKKNIDMIVANNLKVEGAGFGTDTNIVTIITENTATELPRMTKEEVANELLTCIMQEIG